MQTDNCSASSCPAFFPPVHKDLGILTRNSAIVDPCGFPGISPALIDTQFRADPDTGEVKKVNLYQAGSGKIIPKVERSVSESRAERWLLKKDAGYLLPEERVHSCLVFPKKIDGKIADINVMHSKEGNKAFFKGLTACGSVWHCPVCAAKISERRRIELQHAIDQAKDQGLFVNMVTLTVPHGLGDDVKNMLDMMQKAWIKTTSNRAGKDFREIIGYKGCIRVLEVTHGENGFHPHFHVLFFFKTQMTTETMKILFAPIWIDSCVKAGLPKPDWQYGCSVDNGEKAAQYVTKWGMAEEMSKGHLKKAKKGDTPWDLLRKWTFDRDEKAKDLFKVYAHAFKGRRQLFWSKGLKKFFGIDDLTDKELSEQDTEEAFILATLTRSQWWYIVDNHHQSYVLDLAEKEDKKHFWAYIEDIPVGYEFERAKKLQENPELYARPKRKRRQRSKKT